MDCVDMLLAEISANSAANDSNTNAFAAVFQTTLNQTPEHWKGSNLTQPAFFFLPSS